MANYLYAAMDGPEPRETFELSHPISQKPYTKHPISGVPIRKVVTAPNLSCGKSVKSAHASSCGCCRT